MEAVKARKKQAEIDAKDIALQGSIDLSRDIERIASTILALKVDVTNVRKHRKTEINKGGDNNR